MLTRGSTPLISLTIALVLGTTTTVARGDEKADAARHWEAAIGLRDSGDYAGAIAELKVAYDLSPEPAVLFALGKAYVTLDKPVEAVDAFERFLATGKNRVSRQQRVEAEMALRKQRERIGIVDVRVSPTGATISLDGVELGVAPLANKIRAAAGLHTVVVSLSGHSPSTLEIEVIGGKDKPIELTLQPLPVPKGTLKVECQVPDVAVTANGIALGSTPVTSQIQLPSGEYRIRFKRFGYVDTDKLVSVIADRPVSLQCGIKQLAPLPSQVRARLRIVGADRSVRTQVDGEFVPAEVDLPAGNHNILVTRFGYRPWERGVTLVAGRTTDISPELAPSGDRANPAETRTSSSQRTWAYALGVSGLVMGVGALGLKVWNDEHYIKQRDQASRDYQQYHSGVREWTEQEISWDLALANRQHDLNRKAVIVNGIDIGLAVGTGALLCTGVALWLGSSPDGDANKVAVVPRRDGASISWRGTLW